MFNNSIKNSIIRITFAAKGGFFAAKSKLVYWKGILTLLSNAVAQITILMILFSLINMLDMPSHCIIFCFLIQLFCFYFSINIIFI